MKSWTIAPLIAACSIMTVADATEQVGAVKRPATISAPRYGLGRPDPNRPHGRLVEKNGALVYNATYPSMEFEDPHRKLNGKVHNLETLFIQFEKTRQTTGEWWYCEGEVVQIIEAGVLMRMGKPSDPLILARNLPFTGLVDGSKIRFFAAHDVPFDYVTVRGSKSTIRSVDYGGRLSRVEWMPIVAAHREELARQQASAAEAESKIEIEKRKAEADKQRRIVEVLKERVEKGSVDAARDLADRYSTGNGVEVDIEKAKSLRELARSREEKRRR